MFSFENFALTFVVGLMGFALLSILSVFILG